MEYYGYLKLFKNLPINQVMEIVEEVDMEMDLSVVM